jgi:hypothetical protein
MKIGWIFFWFKAVTAGLTCIICAKNDQSEPLKKDFFEPLKKSFQTML